MTKRSKRILFYSAVAVFLFLSYAVILYAQGYKYSFSNNRFVRTGAISLRVSTDASIYLDDKLKGETSFFGDSFSINRLLPGRYQLKVQKDGHSVWQKKVTVEEGFVTDFSKILILPQSGEDKDKILKDIENLFIAQATPSPTAPASTVSGSSASSPSTTPKITPSPKTGKKPTPTPEVYTEPFVLKNKTLSRNNNQQLDKIADEVLGFSLSKYTNKILWWTSTELWVMWLNDTDYQPYRNNGDVDFVFRFSVTPKNVVWFPDEDHILVDSNGYKVLEIDKRGGVNVVDL